MVPDVIDLMFEVEYKVIFEKYDRFFKNENICNWKDNKCRRMQEAEEAGVNGSNSCCPRSCPNLSSTGCSTKNILCKRFHCYSAMMFVEKRGLQEKRKEVEEEFKAFRSRWFHLYKGIDYYQSFEEIIHSRIDRDGVE